VITGWFVALSRVRQAFAGTARLVPTAGTQPLSTTAPRTTTVPPGSATGNSGTPAGLWIAILLVLAVLVAAAYWIRSRLRGR